MLITAGLVIAACGDDDDSGDTASGATDAPVATDAPDAPDVDLEAYCAAVIAIETAPEPEIDWETATDEEMADAAKQWATDTLRPLADAVLAAAPDELGDHHAVLSGAVDELAETGDFEVFESPEFTEASTSVHVFDVENCGWATVDVALVDYAFGGIPDELESGITSFELTNAGEEPHELVLLKKNEGVTATVDELFDMPEEEAMQLVEFIGVGFVWEPDGGSGFLVADLTPGDYIAACFFPVGGEHEEGPPHFTEGMVHEFSVT